MRYRVIETVQDIHIHRKKSRDTHPSLETSSEKHIHTVNFTDTSEERHFIETTQEKHIHTVNFTDTSQEMHFMETTH
jgi:hypothetical protein